MNKRSTLKAVAAAAIFALAGLAQAQQTIKIANIVELSGPRQLNDVGDLDGLLGLRQASQRKNCGSGNSLQRGTFVHG